MKTSMDVDDFIRTGLRAGHSTSYMVTLLRASGMDVDDAYGRIAMVTERMHEEEFQAAEAKAQEKTLRERVTAWLVANGHEPQAYACRDSYGRYALGTAFSSFTEAVKIVEKISAELGVTGVTIDSPFLFWREIEVDPSEFDVEGG